MDLQVRIRDIGEGKSLKYQGKIPYENMEDILTAIGNQPHGALFRIQISRQGRFFFVKGVVEGEMIFNCDRCLEPYRYFQNETLELTLSPAESDKELTGDIMLSGEELDVEIYQGECLDLQKNCGRADLIGTSDEKGLFGGLSGYLSPMWQQPQYSDMRLSPTGQCSSSFFLFNPVTDKRWSCRHGANFRTGFST
jgi:hypothetical protein